jgi:hypothetical protein
MELQQILLILGACGIVLMLMFAIAMGISNETIGTPRLTSKSEESDNCPGPDVIKIPKYKKQFSPTYHLSNLLSAGTCPTGYTHFADSYGNSLCCGSPNIDVFSHTCPSTGPDGVCSMAPGIVDSRQLSGDVKHDPICQEIIHQQQMSRSGALCPRRFPNHVNVPNSQGFYKCCKGQPNSSKTDCAGGTSCSGLIGGQNMFNTPASCETDRLLEKLSCPPGTNLVEKLRGTSIRTRDLSIPVCVGVKGNCIDKIALDELRLLGYFQDINPEKNIMNCDVYQKVYNERIWTQSQAEMRHSKDLG